MSIFIILRCIYPFFEKVIGIESCLLFRDMNGRSPGVTCINSVKQLIPGIYMCTVPFNRRGGGCGAAMRAVPIGLLYWRPEHVESLVRVAVEAGRMTHNHPTG